MDGKDVALLRRCAELAGQALAAGEGPFGSVLTDADGVVLAEDRNRESAEADFSSHPEFRLSQWAFANLDPAARAAAVVYTSGEHCPMCSAAHGWAGLGRIVYAVSASQLARWRAEFGQPAAAVAPLPITTVLPGHQVDGPAEELAAELRELHRQAAN